MPAIRSVLALLSPPVFVPCRPFIGGSRIFCLTLSFTAIHDSRFLSIYALRASPVAAYVSTTRWMEEQRPIRGTVHRINGWVYSGQSWPTFLLVSFYRFSFSSYSIHNASQRKRFLHESHTGATFNVALACNSGATTEANDLLS